jgi:hypothetical protein
MNPRPKTSGSMMLELCIALALFVIVISGITTGMYYVDDEIKNIEKFRDAQSLTKTILTEAMIKTEKEFNSVVSMSTTSDLFTMSLRVQDVSPCKKHLISDTYWNSNLRSHNVSFGVFITDPDFTKKVGGDCDGYISSSSPIITLQNHSGEVDNATIDVLNSLIYSTETTATSTTLTIFKDTTALASLQLDSTILDIDAINDTIFAASASSSDQVIIIDTSDTSKPYIQNKKTLPGVSGSFPGGRSLKFFDNKLYVGTHRTAGHEFHIFDVTDRAHPLWLGSKELNHNINQIIIRDQYAYLATSGNTKDIIILDISHPEAIVQIAALELSGNEDSQCLYVIGNLLYVGRAKAKSATNPEFVIVDISNPVNPTIIGSLYLGQTIKSIIVRNAIAYLLLGSTPSQIAEVNVIDPSHPVIATTKTQNANQPLFHLDYEENTLYGF